MRPIYCGNLEQGTRYSDLESLFSKYGEIAQIDLKRGYAFVYFKDDRNGYDAIRGLHNKQFRNDGIRLAVDWGKGESARHHGVSGPSQPPTKTLFVINYDTTHTRKYDIERHFESYGKIRNIRMNRHFAFVQFETQEDATKALNRTHMSKLLGRVITVEYALREDDEGRYNSPRENYRRREYGASRRSRSPAYGVRSSPDYSGYTGPSSGPSTRSPDTLTHRRSPSPAHRRFRSSPDYRRYTGRSSSPSTRSPDPVRYRRSPSPAHRRFRSSPDYLRYTGRSSSPSTRSPDPVRYRRRSPRRSLRD